MWKIVEVDRYEIVPNEYKYAVGKFRPATPAEIVEYLKEYMLDKLEKNIPPESAEIIFEAMEMPGIHEWEDEDGHTHTEEQWDKVRVELTPQDLKGG